MVRSQPMKICRKPAEGYSEIIEHDSTADFDKAMYHELFYKNKKKSRMDCKWVILLLGAVVIIGGLGWLVYEVRIIGDKTYRMHTHHELQRSERSETSISSNFSDFSKPNRSNSIQSHDRKKRNISNETDIVIDSNLLNETDINTEVIDLSNMTDINIDSKPKLYLLYIDMMEKFEKFEKTFRVFKAVMSKVKKLFSTKIEPTVLNRNARELVDVIKTENVTSDSPVVTELGSKTVNAAESGIGASTEAYTRDTSSELTMPIRNSNSSDPEIHLTDAPMPDTGIPPVPTTIVIDTERNQSKNHLSNRDVTSLYSKSTVNRDSLSNGENAVDYTTNSIIDEISSTATIENQQTDNSFADSMTGKEIQVDTRQSNESHIMKIPPNSPVEDKSTEEPIEYCNDCTTLESIQVSDHVNTGEESPERTAEESPQRTVDESSEKNETMFEQWMEYSLKNIPSDYEPEKILLKIKNYLESNSGSKRSFRSVNESDAPWKLYCFRKVSNAEGKIEAKIINVPLNKSEIEKLPNIRFRSKDDVVQYSKDDLPPYSAHSLHTHQLFDGYSKKNSSISNDTSGFFNGLYDSSDVFSFTSDQGGAGGSYYCTYSKSFRSESQNESLKDVKTLERELDWKDLENDLCSASQRMCADGSQCVASGAWCNGIINCADRSDELKCSCKERMDVQKICDGYFDCPDGEDESGCFGCSENEFSCDDWGRWKLNVTCLPMSARCDRIADCANQKDEQECELLSDKIFSHDTFLVSYTSGYLHRNWKGKWYPVCADENDESSTKACENELGVANLRNIDVVVKPIPTPYTGQFITSVKNQFQLIDQCDAVKSAVYVNCPTEYCGTRKAYNSDRLTYRYRRDSIDSKDILAKETTSMLETLREVILESRRNEYRYKRDLGDTPDTQPIPLEPLLRLLILDEEKTRIRRDPILRVVGGKISGPGSWPWIIALYKNGIFHCGGVILDETWIMTAAHCVQEYRENYFEVQAGILRRLSFSPMEQNRAVTHVIIHNKYSRSDMINDIALLRVEPPLKMNRWIRPICLPEARPPWGPAPGTKCTAVGWGATQEHGPDPDNMRDVEVPILSYCKHEADREGDEICAGYLSGGHDTCQGDSGGPLLCKIPLTKDRWYVGGIVSHGEGCARPMEPGAYTRIALYLPWLVENADDKSLSKKRQSTPRCPGMRCADGGRCISKKRICDNVIDCLGGEDEANCSSKWTPKYKHNHPIHENPRSGETIEYHTGKNDQEKEPIIHSLDELKKSHNSATIASITANDSVVSDPWWRKEILHKWDEEFSHVEKFTCTIIEQSLPKIFYCDGEVDCEDGTDEINCTCADWLRSVNQSLICNGIVDCYDSTDEKNCSQKNCTENEFYCYQSKTCINKTQQCDGIVNCAGGEDEKNCYALSESMKISFDYFNVPIFARNGIVMENENGTWKPYCTLSTSPKKNNDICDHLGFKGAIGMEKIRFAEACAGLYGTELTCGIHQNDTSVLPWLAHIYVNGHKRCTGVLLTNEWIITNHNCRSHKRFHLQKDHIVAVLGGHRETDGLIQSLDEQIIFADYVNETNEQNVTIIHLQKPAKESKFVRPIRLHDILVTPRPEQDPKYPCFSIAGLHKPVVINFVADSNCNSAYCRFKPKNKTNLCSHHHRHSTITGMICLSRIDEWHLTATLGPELDAFCSSNATKFRLPTWDDPRILYDLDFRKTWSSQPSTCINGYQCKLGKCLSWSQLCDGKTDCRNNEDETQESCASKKTHCYLEKGDCACNVHEFACKKGSNKCIDKNLICDGVKNCADGSDEPPECSSFTCATYLNMTHPHKLCDTHVDCADKSDEDLVTCPSFCNTTPHFVCTNSSQCIPMEFVCDGESDCPHKEDEDNCSDLKNNITNSNEPNVFIRTHGIWQKGCLGSDVTGFSPLSACKTANKTEVIKYNTIPGTKTPTPEYRRVKLRNGKEFKLKSKPIVHWNFTEVCDYVHLNCK